MRERLIIKILFVIARIIAGTDTKLNGEVTTLANSISYDYRPEKEGN